jgi:rod shape determining protein RodA
MNLGTRDDTGLSTSGMPVAGRRTRLAPLSMGVSTTSKSLRRLVSRESWVRRFDWLLAGSALALSLYGAVLVWAATKDKPDLTGGDPRYFLKRHLLNLAIGVVLALVTVKLDHRWLRAYVPILYVLSLLGLLAVLSPLGSTVNGAKSWIQLGAGFSLQPAEFAKVGMALAMAMVLSQRSSTSQENAPPKPRRILGALVVAAVPCGLIVILPDLGSTMVLVAISAGILVVSGIALRWLALMTLGAGLGVLLVVKLHLLAKHQTDRFLAFANPKLDPQGVGYNEAQAKLAIGAGHFSGEGLGKGVQTNGQYVPEQQTDFIFTVVGEELGFVGGVVMIALFALLLWRAMRIARTASDMFGMLASTGIVCWLTFQMFENIGMTMGIMPVAGIPLPFVSYGGSEMFASFIGIGFLENVRLRSTRPPGNGTIANPKGTVFSKPLING